MQRLTFLVLLAACAVALSPMDAKSKAAVSSSSAIAGIWVVAKGRSEREKRRDALAEGELNLAKEVRNVAKLESETARLKTKLEDELRAIALKEKDADVAIALKEKDAEFMREEAAKIVEYGKQQIEKARDRDATELREAIALARSKAAKRIWAIRKKAWAHRKELIERGDLDAMDAIAEARAEIEQERAAIARYKDSLDQEIEDVHKELEEAMNESLTRSLAILEAAKEQEKVKWMVNFTQQYDAAKKEIGNLRARIRMLQSELSDSRDIKLCRETGLAHAERANDILIWLKGKHGIYADWLFSSIDEYGVFRMGFDLWVEDPKSLKKLEALMPLLRNRLGCPEEPTIAFGNDATCYILTALPRSASAQVSTKLEDLYKRSLPDIDLPPGFAGIESSLRDQIANELTFQAEQEAMLSFVPPVPIKPRSLNITGDELTCYRYYMYYQSQATKGTQPNVTTKNELMYLIYGVAPGYSSYQRKDPALLETLSQRYDRVMQMLGMKPEQLEAEKENEIY